MTVLLRSDCIENSCTVSAVEPPQWHMKNKAVQLVIEGSSRWWNACPDRMLAHVPCSSLQEMPGNNIEYVYINTRQRVIALSPGNVAVMLK